MDISASLVIQQPADTVFACLSNCRSTGLWSSLVITSEPLSPAEREPRVGYGYQQRVKLLNRLWEVSYQVIEFEPPRRITAKTTAGWLPGLVMYSLEPQGRATRLRYHQAVELAAFFQPFAEVLQTSLERQTVLDLANLKDWLESGLYRQASESFPA